MFLSAGCGLGSSWGSFRALVVVIIRPCPRFVGRCSYLKYLIVVPTVFVDESQQTHFDPCQHSCAVCVALDLRPFNCTVHIQRISLAKAFRFVFVMTCAMAMVLDVIQGVRLVFAIMPMPGRV